MFWKEGAGNSGPLVRNVCAECFRNSREGAEGLAIADGVSKGPGHEEVRLLPGVREGRRSRCVMPRSILEV